MVTGRVLTEDGKPLPGARVRAKGAATPGFGGLGFLGESEGITDGQGRYVLDGVSPGAKVRVVARHTVTTDGASEPFEVGTGGSVRAPDVTLRSGKRVDVLVRDPDGRPLPKARVELSYDRGDVPDWDTFDMWSNDANLATDAQGHVRQDQVPACKLTVTATHPDFARGKAVETIAPDATSPIRVEVSVTVPVTVGGQVLDDGGRPVGGALVAVQPAGETVAVERAATDAEGRFVVAGVPTGPFTLHASKQGFRPYEAELGVAREDLVVTLQQVSPETAARRAELQSRLQEIFGRLGSARERQGARGDHGGDPGRERGAAGPRRGVDGPLTRVRCQARRQGASALSLASCLAPDEGQLRAQAPSGPTRSGRPARRGTASVPLKIRRPTERSRRSTLCCGPGFESLDAPGGRVEARHRSDPPAPRPASRASARWTAGPRTTRGWPRPRARWTPRPGAP